jgi:hypothetical protein
MRSRRTLGNEDVDAFERWLHAEAACTASDVPHRIPRRHPLRRSKRV